MVKVVVAYVSTPTHTLACTPSGAGFRSQIASVRMILVQQQYYIMSFVVC